MVYTYILFMAWSIELWETKFLNKWFKLSKRGNLFWDKMKILWDTIKILSKIDSYSSNIA